MKASTITLGGILSGLTIIFLYLASVFKTNTLSFLTLASFMVPIGLIRGGLKAACLIYISSSFIAFMVIPLPITFLYILFFGIYGLIKYFSELSKNILLENFLKLLFANSIFALLLFIFQSLLGYDFFDKLSFFTARLPVFISPPISYIFIGLLAQSAFLIYDYALTLLIDYYHRYLGKF